MRALAVSESVVDPKWLRHFIARSQNPAVARTSLQTVRLDLFSAVIMGTKYHNTGISQPEFRQYMQDILNPLVLQRLALYNFF